MNQSNFGFGLPDFRKLDIRYHRLEGEEDAVDGDKKSLEFPHTLIDLDLSAIGSGPAYCIKTLHDQLFEPPFNPQN